MMKITTYKQTAYVIALIICINPLITFANDNPRVDIQTNKGVITVQLAADKVPVTVQNFLTYVDEGFYDNTLFHRVIEGFMIQGGGFNAEFELQETHAPIILETNVGLSNIRGAISMARRTDSDSASSQFFINTVDNLFLDYQNAGSPGYAVFGTVLEGMDVVDSISTQETDATSSGIGLQRDVPISPVIIKTIRPRAGQLNFSAMQSTYSEGEVITVHLHETMPRNESLDLWVAILGGDGRLLFVTETGFSYTPEVFKKSVAENETSHPVFNFTVPQGFNGHYTLLAIFNKLDAGIEDLSQSLRSNLAQSSIDLIQ